MPKEPSGRKERISAAVQPEMLRVIDTYCEEYNVKRAVVGQMALKLWCDVQTGKVHLRRPPSQNKS